MNKIFRTIWNQSLGVWMAVAEITHSSRNSHSSSNTVAMPDIASNHRLPMLPSQYKLCVLTALLGLSVTCPGYAQITTQQKANGSNLVLDQDVNIVLTATGTSGYALWAQNGGQITSVTNQLALVSQSSSVIYAESGGKITLDGTGGGLDISNQVTNIYSPIVVATGSGSSVNLTGATIHGVVGAASNTIRAIAITSGASLHLSDSTVSVVGGTTDSQNGPTGIYFYNAGSSGTLNRVTLNITTASTRDGGSTGILVGNGAVVQANNLIVNMNSNDSGPQVGVNSFGAGSNFTLNNLTLVGTASVNANQIISAVKASQGGLLTVNGGTISGYGIASGLSSGFNDSVLNANNVNVSTRRAMGAQLISAGNGGVLNFTGGTLSTDTIYGMVMVYTVASNSRANLKDASIVMLKGGARTSDSGFGLYALGPSLILADNTLIDISSADSSYRVVGASTRAANSGGQIQLLNGSHINVVGGYSSQYGASYGVLIDGTSNGFTGTDSIITTSRSSPTSGQGVTAVQVQNNGSASLTGMQVTADGAGSMGIVSSGTGTKVNFNAGNTIATNGLNAHGLAVQNGSLFDGSNGAGSSVLAQGSGASALYLSGSGFINTVNLNGTVLNTSLASAINVASGGANLNLTGGSVTAGNAIWLDVAAGANAQVTLANAQRVAGTTQVSTTGTSNLLIQSGSAWMLTGNSALSSLTLNDGQLIFGTNAVINTTDAVTLTGLGGEFNTNGLDVDFGNQLKGDGQLQKTGAGSLILTHANSTVGSVEVQAGVLNLSQKGVFNITGDFTTQSGATTLIGTTPAQLNIAGIFTQRADSTLNVTVGASPDIIADRAILDGVLVLNGFQHGEFPVKASEVEANPYTVIHTTGPAGITGNFTNPVGSDLGIDYLIERGYISADRKDYNIGFLMAWTDGGKTQGTGDFTLNNVNDSFDVDLPLSDQTVPTGGFDSGWSGTTLTKNGAGSLTLSALNTYSGKTNVTGGRLNLAGDGDIAASSQLILSGNDSILDISSLTNHSTTVNNLSGVSTAKVFLSGSDPANVTANTLIVNNAANADSEGNSEFSGVIDDAGLGSNVTKTGAGMLTLSGDNTFTGIMAIDDGTLVIGAGATRGSLASGQLTLSDDSTVIFNRSDDSNYAGLITGSVGSNLVKQGAGMLTLNMANSQLSNSTVEAGILQFMHSGVVTNLGNFTTRYAAETRLGQPDSHLNVSGNFNLEDGSTLSVFVGPQVGEQYASIHAQYADVSDNVSLNVTGFSADYSLLHSSDYQLNDITVIHTDRGLNFTNGATDFAHISVAGATQSVDYLAVEGKKIGSNDYNIGVGLSWYGAHFSLPDGYAPTGNFTLSEANEVFQVDAELNNEASYGQPADLHYWDGQSLTKKGEGTLILSAANTYTGGTLIERGTLALSGNGDISDSRRLSLVSANTRFDISRVDGSGRTVNNLTGVVGSQIAIGDKTLTVNNDSNTLFSGDFTDSQGCLNKTGIGELTLSGKTHWSGNTVLQEGTLTLDGHLGGAQLASNIIGTDGSSLNLIQGATLTGTIDPAHVTIDMASVWNMSGDSEVDTFTLGGTVNFSDPGMSLNQGRTLNVKNWVGDGGTVHLYTALADDSSVTDKLVIEGDTSGTTQVTVTNAGGSGALTLNGIELIQVNGVSAGEFVQSGRIVAGAYDYSLVRGVNSNTNNWYLTSELSLEPIPTPDPTPANNVLRPEAGSYMANMAAASKLFNLRLEDREGRAENSSMWLRQQGDRTKFRDSSGQIKTATNTYVVQGGGEVFDTQFTGTDRLGVGLMLGYGESDSQSGNGRSGYGSKGKVDGYSGGAYATWYQDAKTLDGAYIDSWVQYSLLNATVNGEQLSGESYDINGFSASVESGYRLPVYQGENSRVFITPQAQIIWNGIKADDHREANGTRVSSDGNNNVQTRLGVKLSRDGVSTQDKGNDKLFTVYAEANWLHNTEQAGATMDGITTRQAGNTNVGELKLGAEGQLNKQVNLWTNVAQQMGDDGYSDTALTVGFKYKF